MEHNSLETHVVVIGAGVRGISAAAYLAQAGYKVTVYEKDNVPWGLSRVLNRDGFRFDRCPSWYWMPAEHDRWFADLGARREDYYAVQRLDPNYKIYFGDSLAEEPLRVVTVPAALEATKAMFESYEPGAGKRLDTFLEKARRTHEFVMSERNHRIFNWPFTTYHSLVERYFTHPYLRKILELPVVSLGGLAATIPARYKLINYIDFGLGRWSPEGGVEKVVESMHHLAESYGARFVFNTEVTGVRSSDGRASRVKVRSNCDEDEVHADAVVAGFGWPYGEKTVAPAVLNFDVGFNRKLPSLAHRSYFYNTDRNEHFAVGHGNRRGPDVPYFYLDIPSFTDPSCAPEGHEAVSIRIPWSEGTDDSDELREHCLNIVLNHLEKVTGETLRDTIVFYEAAWLPPMHMSTRLSKLCYAGHSLLQGTETTMSMISGRHAAVRVSLRAPGTRSSPQ
ncbi:MAG: NAD(P)/FAD-dependent oxidoreductase [Spirochaetaceae bacterium]|nr:MAG: NAD(P)/FAD-dependent oxidoreductase [Spirochaetaceae bacterium]